MPKRRSDNINGTAVEWIARRDAGLKPTEESEFERWRSADPRHGQALARFETAWNALGRPRQTGNSAVIKGQIGELDRRQRWRRRGLGAALAVLLTAGSVWSILRSPAVTPSLSAGQTVVLAPDHRALSDGSVIELPSGAEIAVDYSDAMRRVTLKRGQAYFKVAKDPTRPFVVSAGEFEVWAVGTAFSIELGKPEVELLVTEGRVSVDRPALPRSGNASPSVPRHLAIVEAGNRVALRAWEKQVVPSPVFPVSAAEMAERLAWRGTRLEFSGTSLANVVAAVNGYNRVQFVLADSALASVPVSGVFSADDTGTIVRMLDAGFGIIAERRDGDEILLRKAP